MICHARIHNILARSCACDFRMAIRVRLRYVEPLSGRVREARLCVAYPKPEHQGSKTQYIEFQHHEPLYSSQTSGTYTKDPQKHCQQGVLPKNSCNTMLSRLRPKNALSHLTPCLFSLNRTSRLGKAANANAQPCRSALASKPKEKKISFTTTTLYDAKTKRYQS